MIITLGRRKEATAKVQILKGSGRILINKADMNSYIQNNLIYRSLICKPLENLGVIRNYNININVHGGGLKAQTEAVQLGIAKGLYKLNYSYQKSLKSKGYLRRDSRSKERRKYGLKKARKAPQFSKR